MSKQNQATLGVYEQLACSYLEGDLKRQSRNPKKYLDKFNRLKGFIKKGLVDIPKNAKIFEFGSAGGNDIAIFNELGYEITPSDAADSFLRIMQEKGLKPLKFNILTDTFTNQYDLIYSWRTLVHFTYEDTVKVLQKVYDALNPGGRYIFNVLNTEDHNNLDEEWVDFEGDYHLGEKRYYKYWKQSDLINLLEKVRFTVKELEINGGDNNKGWFCIIAEKTEEKAL